MKKKLNRVNGELWRKLIRRLVKVSALSISCVATVVSADVSVPGLFSDYMVLQSDMPVPVWGTASPGESVIVHFAGQNREVTADENGNWSVTLNAMTPDTNPGDMIIRGNNVITITDVQIGAVWLGSGQSNMANRLQDDCDATTAIADVGNYNIRLFNVTGDPSTTNWQVADQTTAPGFSAVHYYFGRHLADALPDVPIGLIVSAVSATAIERWATCAGSGTLYKNQIKPLQPFAIAGSTWYQGEWDARSAGDAGKYYWQLSCLIDEWRTDWGQGSFPFFVVQLPGLSLSQSHIIRDAELQASLSDPNTEMTVNIDYPGCDVHPPCKDEFGRRLSLLARKFVYGQDIVEQGPVLNHGESSISNSEIILVYDNVGNGLQSSDDGLLQHWEIAGADGVYFPAYAEIIEAEIINNSVRISNASVSNPTSVRYAFEKCPANPNLVNSDGSVDISELPASPLREFVVDTGPDNTPPTPDPMTWANPPSASGDTSIAMQASTASDPSGVEYFFDCDSELCNDSNWQDSASYTDTGLTPNTAYSYRVKARDKSQNQNQTAWSTEAEAITTDGSCTPGTVHVESIEPSVRKVGKGNKAGSVAVTVHNNCSDALSNVTVYGTFSGDFIESGQASTNGNGIATIETVESKKGSVSYTFCVDGLIVTGLNFDESNNVETCDNL